MSPKTLHRNKFAFGLSIVCLFLFATILGTMYRPRPQYAEGYSYYDSLEGQLEQIRASVNAISNKYAVYDASFQAIQKQLDTTTETANIAYKKIMKLDNTLNGRG